MITVKQYAEERGITIQAVHQSMNGKRKKEALQGHVHFKDGIKWLDDEAVAILDKDRKKSAYLIEKADSTEEIESLKRQVEQLLIKTAAQADRISELAQWKADNAVAIAEANQQQLLLEERTMKIGQLEASLNEAKTATKETEDKLHLTEQRADQLEAQLQEEQSRPLSLSERITGKKRKKD